MALPTNANANANFSVAIIGAGLGGLQLVEFTQVYELEISPISRNQGGTLDLHPECGQCALQIAGLSKELRKIAHAEADTMRIVDKTGRVTYNDEEMTGPPRRPERPGGPVASQGEQGDDHQEDLLMEERSKVDRGELRHISFYSLLPNTILWGYNLSSCELICDDKVELHFSGPQPQPRLRSTWL